MKHSIVCGKQTNDLMEACELSNCWKVVSVFWINLQFILPARVVEVVRHSCQEPKAIGEPRAFLYYCGCSSLLSSLDDKKKKFLFLEKTKIMVGENEVKAVGT